MFETSSGIEFVVLDIYVSRSVDLAAVVERMRTTIAHGGLRAAVRPTAAPLEGWKEGDLLWEAPTARKTAWYVTGRF